MPAHGRHRARRRARARDVGDRHETGISRQPLYRYFPDVAAVLVAMTRMAGEMEADLADRISAADDAAAGLRKKRRRCG